MALPVGSQTQWPGLARDLAILSAPDSPLSGIDVILETYGLTQADLRELALVPAFQDMYARELESVRAKGDRAGALYRAATFSQSLAEKLYRDAVAGRMEAKEAIRLLETLLKAAGLSGDGGTTVNVQNNVGVAIPVPRLNNPKLDHLREA